MPNIRCWLENSLTRIYPVSSAKKTQTMDMVCARGERVSFQVGVRNLGNLAPIAEVEVPSHTDMNIRVRRVGFVSIPHHNTQTTRAEMDSHESVPGLVPDPLFPESTTILGPFETQSFWISVAIPADTDPGLREVTVYVSEDKTVIAELKVLLNVVSLTLRRRSSFPVTHWFYADSLCDWYHVEPFEEAFWDILQPYIENLIDHGNNCMYIPIFTPPTDGVKRPTQLLGVSKTAGGRYEFDFSNVRRWLRIAQMCGAQFFEWTHFFSQWGAENALRIYLDNSDASSLLWPPETPATSDVYRSFLGQFLPKFHAFLVTEKILEKSVFHISDEPHGEDHLANYKAARTVIRDLAPWMKISDALSDIAYGKEGLVDFPIPVISSAKEYADSGIPAWTYFCCGPRGKYLNRLVDTPLAKIRMSGWLFYHLKAQGFLHWGFNYWYKMSTQQLIDPFTELAGGMWPNMAYGDAFVVYPGPTGPIDSIRWEVFAESLQDYAILEAVGAQAPDYGAAKIISYDNFPKDAEWVIQARQKLLTP